MTHGYLSSVPSNSRALQVLAPVVQTLDSAIHPIKIYPVDDAIVFPNTYPLDSDLSGDSAIQRLNNWDLYPQVNLILPAMLLLTQTLERFSLDCRKTKTKVNTLANQRA